MPKYDIAFAKAKEVLDKLNYDPDKMIRTNDIINVVEEMLNIDVKFKKQDFNNIKTQKNTQKIFSNCGAIMYVDKTTNPVKAFIFLNEQESPEMVRFSLVHELGHLMTRTLDSFENFEASMHINMDITSISEELINKYSFLVEEQVANIFALLVLIPYDSLVKAVLKFGTIKEVAKFFGVEEDAVISRLRLQERNNA